MWFKWMLIGLFALQAILTTARIGQPQEPTSPVTASITTTINALLIVGILHYWGVQ